MEIHELLVPSLVEYGSSDSVILDCNYDVSDEEKGGIEVKWYFGDEKSPFLQWVPGERAWRVAASKH